MKQPSIPGLRDLSQELRDRMTTLVNEEERAMILLESIREKMEVTRKMLALEEGVPAATTGGSLTRLRPEKRTRDVHSIVRERLLAGVTNKDSIIMAVEKEGHVKPGRAVNAALMTFKRYGHVDPQGPDGREFVLTPKGREALNREAEGSN